MASAHRVYLMQDLLTPVTPLPCVNMEHRAVGK